jgi:pseudouridine synthase
MLVRLQKYLADQGVGSRRQCEKYIADGMVMVNNEIVKEMGVKVDTDKDAVVYDSRRIKKVIESFTYVMIYKPRGYECTLSVDVAKNIGELVSDLGIRLVGVGRLDKDSEGMFIMTNDGSLVNKLTHPSFEHEKEYEVMVSGDVSPLKLAKMANGTLRIEGKNISPCTVEYIRDGEKDGRSLLRFVLTEGRNRQIRRMCEEVGLEVKRLKRIRIGSLVMKGLRVGDVKILTKKEVSQLSEVGVVE